MCLPFTVLITHASSLAVNCIVSKICINFLTDVVVDHLKVIVIASC